MTDEMKPVHCGCGGEAKVELLPFETWNDIWDASVSQYLVRCDRCGMTTRLHDTEAEAVMAWNRAMGKQTGMMTNHEVACLLADLFDDPCACNYNGIDEWLPEKCELQESCPNPVGVACWEQFLKYRGDVSLGNSEKK